MFHLVRFAFTLHFVKYTKHCKHLSHKRDKIKEERDDNVTQTISNVCSEQLVDLKVTMPEIIQYNRAFPA